MRSSIKPKIFVIILNYNGRDTIKKCLDSVFYSDYPNFEAVLVDNNSKDGSLELAKRLYPKFHFIKNEGNIGFAAGNNIGIRFALEKMADYIFLLNNDAVLEKDTLSRLVEAAEKEKEYGIFSPIIYDGNNNIWFARGEIKWLRMKAIHLTDNPRSNKPYSTKCISGCAMLIKKEVFRKIGLLSEDYFLYYEDTDFCLRASKQGFNCLVVPESKVVHFEKSESDLSNKIYWLVLSGLIFFSKNTPRPLKLFTGSYFYLRKVKNFIDNLGVRSKYSGIVKKSYLDFKKWKKIQKYPL